ncbi:MAG: entericidin A/B family lipoprotein [Deltaproteobacteria bacterium]|nr:entericidin A/B family lipoprotein [Deltaproteobacteria bacterium]
MRKLSFWVMVALVASISTSALLACNTVKGVGKDVTAVGEAGSDAVNKATK